MLILFWRLAKIDNVKGPSLHAISANQKRGVRPTLGRGWCKFVTVGGWGDRSLDMWDNRICCCVVAICVVDT